MKQKAIDLANRIGLLRSHAQTLRLTDEASPLAKRLQRRLTAATTGVDDSYRAACTADSREGFMRHISAAARHAKRVKELLQDLTGLNHVSIEASRELISEARGLETVLTASKNTARRRAWRLRVGLPSERAVTASAKNGP